jgi:exosortase/archaeosortase family protein
LHWIRRLFLLGLGITLAFILNCIRAFFLALLHVEGGGKTLERWHDPAGYAILLVSFASLLLLAKLLSPRTSLPAAFTSSTLPVKSFSNLLLLVGILWFLICEAGTELWYRSHESKQGEKISWSLAWPEESASFQKEAISEKVHSILRYNEGTHGILKNSDGTIWSLFEFIWHPGRVSAQLARSHSPEICMPAAGARLIQHSGPELWSIGPVTLPVQLYTFQSGSQTWQVYYIVWEDQSEQSPLDDPQDFYHYSTKLHAVMEGRRHLGQRVIEIVTSGYPNSAQGKTAVMDYLKKYLRVK